MELQGRLPAPNLVTLDAKGKVPTGGTKDPRRTLFPHQLTQSFFFNGTQEGRSKYYLFNRCGDLKHLSRYSSYEDPEACYCGSDLTGMTKRAKG